MVSNETYLAPATCSTLLLDNKLQCKYTRKICAFNDVTNK